MKERGAGAMLVATRRIAAPRERVFAAWTSPEMLREWWGPRGCTCPEAAVDLRPGGEYRLVMRMESGPDIAVRGTYEHVEPPAKLVYTWRWEAGPTMEPESLVTVEFREIEGGTEVVVIHGQFPAEHDISLYTTGWDDALEKLETAVLGAGAG